MRRTISGAALFGLLVATAGCTRGSSDPLAEVRALQADGRYEETLDTLRALMDDDPTDPELNFLFGKTLMRTGDPSLAIWPLQRSAKTPEYAFESGMLLAEATIDSRTPQDAIEAIDIALSVRPDSVDALALRARANLKSGRPADALADVETAVALDPRASAIFVPRVLALLAFSRVDEAEAVLEAREPSAAGERDPVEDGIQARLCRANASFAFENGDRKSAEVIYSDCLDAYPINRLVVLQAVEFYDAIGDADRGTALLRQIFEDTSATHFGSALARRVRRLGAEVDNHEPRDSEADPLPSERARLPGGATSI